MEKWRESERDGKRDERERDGERDGRERDVVLCLLTFVYCLFHLLLQCKHVSHGVRNKERERT